MSWDGAFRLARLLMFGGAGALVACRYGWAAVALCGLAVVLHGVEVLASRSAHEARVRALEAAVGELQAGQKKQALTLEAVQTAARKPGF